MRRNIRRAEETITGLPVPSQNNVCAYFLQRGYNDSRNALETTSPYVCTLLSSCPPVRPDTVDNENLKRLLIRFLRFLLVLC